MFLQMVAHGQTHEQQYPTVRVNLRRTLAMGKGNRSGGCGQLSHKINNDLFDEMVINCIDEGKIGEDLFGSERTRAYKSKKKVTSKGTKQSKAKKSRKSAYESLHSPKHKPIGHPARRPLPILSNVSTSHLRPTKLSSPTPTDSSAIKDSLKPSSNPSDQSPSAEPNDVPQSETGQISLILQQSDTQSLQRSHSPSSLSDSTLFSPHCVVHLSDPPNLQNNPSSGSQPDSQPKTQPTSRPIGSSSSMTNNELQQPTSTTRPSSDYIGNSGENVFRYPTVSPSLSPSNSTKNQAPSDKPSISPAQTSTLTSLEPSLSPSSALTTILPVAPSDSPIGSPTRESILSSSVPTSSPSTDLTTGTGLSFTASAFPTAVSPTLTPTPSISPTTWQPQRVSVSPTQQSALAPSLSPSQSQRNNSTALACLPKSNGDFGGATGVAQEVSFLYEIEVFPNVVLDVVKFQILAQVENRASRTLISALFTGRCAETRRLSEGVQGIGISPADELLVDVACIGTRWSNANKCFVVNGKLTLYFDTVGNIASNVATSKIALRSAMDRGDFNMLDQRVASVTYRNETTIQNDPGFTTSNARNGEESKIARSGWILIGCGGFVLVTLLCVCFRLKSSKSRHKRRSDCVPEVTNSGHVDQLIRTQSANKYLPNTEDRLVMSVMMYNNNVNVPVSPGIHRTPSFSESTIKIKQPLDRKLDGTSLQDRYLQEQDLFTKASSMASSSLQSIYSSQEKSATQRVTFPGAVFSMSAPPPAKLVDTEELLIASNNYADVHLSLASVGYLPSMHVHGDDDECSQSDTYSESSSEGLSCESYQSEPGHYPNVNPHLNDNEYQYHFSSDSDVSLAKPAAR